MARFLRAHARGDILCDLLLQMKLKLVVEMCAFFATVKEHFYLHGKFVQPAHPRSPQAS
jgi:hypothetical protein